MQRLVLFAMFCVWSGCLGVVMLTSVKAHGQHHASCKGVKRCKNPREQAVLETLLHVHPCASSIGKEEWICIYPVCKVACFGQRFRCLYLRGPSVLLPCAGQDNKYNISCSFDCSPVPLSISNTSLSTTTRLLGSLRMPHSSCSL